MFQTCVGSWELFADLGPALCLVLALSWISNVSERRPSSQRNRVSVQNIAGPVQMAQSHSPRWRRNSQLRRPSTVSMVSSLTNVLTWEVLVNGRLGRMCIEEKVALKLQRAPSRIEKER